MSIAFKYYFENNRSFISVCMHPDGGSTLTGIGNKLFGLNEKLKMQNRQFFLGTSTRVKLPKELFLNIDAGFLIIRKLIFSKSSSNLRNAENLYLTKIANTEFVQIGLIYKFLPNRYTNYLKNDEVEWFQEF
jgi:hypothetical protein